MYARKPNASQSPEGRGASGFTLLELLVVMGIITVLAAILLPTLASVGRAARIANTESLIRRLDVAVNHYQRDQGCFPPDFVPAGAKLREFTPTGGQEWTPTPLYPPEALYYYLANPFLSGSHPYLALTVDTETRDLNANGVREVVDSWGRPILYDRPPFPGGGSFNYAEPSQGIHKLESCDLYSLGPDGQTRKKSDDPAQPDETAVVPDPGVSGLSAYCAAAMVKNTAGTSADDISNWKRQ